MQYTSKAHQKEVFDIFDPAFLQGPEIFLFDPMPAVLCQVLVAKCLVYQGLDAVTHNLRILIILKYGIDFFLEL